jgi:phage terminase large subunit-like protein
VVVVVSDGVDGVDGGLLSDLALVERRDFSAASLLFWGRLCYPEFRLFPHVKFLGGELAGLVSGDWDRLVVCLPPRHSKSYLACRFYEWVLTFFGWRVLLFSYSSVLAELFVREVRDVFSDGSAPNLRVRDVLGFEGVSLRQDWRGSDGFGLSNGGSLKGCGVGGSLTGLGCDLLAVDDPFKNDRAAASKLVRDSVWDVYLSAGVTRLEPGGRVLIVSTRWHEDDLVGRVLASEGDLADGGRWRVCVLPALAIENDLLGRRVGEALCPDRFGEDVLKNNRVVLGAHTFACLYQQNPAPEVGDVFSRGWERLWSSGGDGVVTVRGEKVDVSTLFKFVSVDPAGAVSKRSDFSVGMVWGVVPGSGLLVLLGVVRGRFRGAEFVERLTGVAEFWGLSLFGVEGGPVGLGVIDGLRDAGFRVDVLSDRSGGKQGRAYPAAAAFEAGKIFFPDAAADRDGVVDIVRDELYRFPNGRFDDCVDALGWGVHMWRLLRSRFTGAGGFVSDHVDGRAVSRLNGQGDSSESFLSSDSSGSSSLLRSPEGFV